MSRCQETTPGLSDNFALLQFFLQTLLLLAEISITVCHLA